MTSAGSNPADSQRPLLVLVTGPPAAGKNTLARILAERLPCPLLSRDELKEGLVFTLGAAYPSRSNDSQERANAAFFGAMRLLLDQGISLVAEAAFQDAVWRQGLEPCLDLADLRVIHLHVDAALVRDRVATRLEQQPLRQRAHDAADYLRSLDEGTAWSSDFVRLSIPAPAIHVDSSDGYEPGLEEVLSFLRS